MERKIIARNWRQISEWIYQYIRVYYVYSSLLLLYFGQINDGDYDDDDDELGSTIESKNKHIAADN